MDYVCGQTEFSDLIDTCFNDEEYTKNIDLYRIIAYTNSRVAQWIKKRLLHSIQMRR